MSARVKAVRGAGSSGAAVSEAIKRTRSYAEFARSLTEAIYLTFSGLILGLCLARANRGVSMHQARSTEILTPSNSVRTLCNSVSA